MVSHPLNSSSPVGLNSDNPVYVGLKMVIDLKGGIATHRGGVIILLLLRAIAALT